MTTTWISIDMARIETDTTTLFQRYPHLRTVADLWGSRECREFLVGLMFDTRDGQRQGFDPATAMTIFALLDEHDARFPNHAARATDGIWSEGVGRAPRY
jgi:hypothetical protein